MIENCWPWRAVGRGLLAALVALSLGLAQTGPAIAQQTYEIEAADLDETFTIAGQQFTARNLCHDFEVGDEVEVVAGEPLDICDKAEFKNLRNDNTCEVWCD